MNHLLYRLNYWMRNAVQLKYHCIVYYKNEKIFACKDNNEAEEHIKRMYNTVSNMSTKTDQPHILNLLHPEETSCWHKFRNNFKIGNE